MLIIIIIIVQVESAFSSSNAAKVQRTHAMRVPSLNRELTLKTRPASFSSASSSSSTISLNGESESKPLARTSALLPELDINLHEKTNLQPKMSKQVRVNSVPNLIDPMAGTQSERLDPARDGVFARMRNRMLRYGSAVAIGSAIGVGGITAKQLLSQNYNNNFTEPINATVQSSNRTDFDDLNNPFDKK